MDKHSNELKNIIKRLPNEGNRSGWVAKTQSILKKKRLKKVSDSLLYGLVNDHIPLASSNMHVVPVIIQAVDEILEEIQAVKFSIKNANAQ